MTVLLQISESHLTKKSDGWYAKLTGEDIISIYVK